MDEFRSKQTNPYSSQPEPPKQQVNFVTPEPQVSPPMPSLNPPEPATTMVVPTPEPTFVPVAPVPEPKPVAENFTATPEPTLVPELIPEPSTTSYSPPEPQSPPVQTMDAVAKPQKKPLPKFLIIVPVALLLLSSLSGGGWLLYSKQADRLEGQLDSAKKEISSLKSGKFGSTGGQGLSLMGAGGQGEVAGENTSADIIEDYIYSGQVVVRNNQLLMEVYVDTTVTGKIESVWANYGGNKTNLIQQTEKTTEGLSDKQEGIVQMIAIGDLADFEPGSSYMYRMSAKAKNGKIYKSGYAVLTIPQAENTQPQSTSSTGSGL